MEKCLWWCIYYINWPSLHSVMVSLTCLPVSKIRTNNLYIFWQCTCNFVVYIYYGFSLLHNFSLVLQPWMSAYIRKTDGVYISVSQKSLRLPNSVSHYQTFGLVKTPFSPDQTEFHRTEKYQAFPAVVAFNQGLPIFHFSF
jgi:hypothetical protein